MVLIAHVSDVHVDSGERSGERAARPFVDRIRQFGAGRLAAVIERYPQVVALLCGHAHTPAVTTFAGRPLLIAPGVVSTSMLPFETEAIVDPAQPPMIAFHLLDDDRHLTTHYRVIL